MSKKRKTKLTSKQRGQKKARKKNTEIIFINGKQKRVRREPTVDEIEAEFTRQNADPIFLHQNEMWEYTEPESESTPESKRGYYADDEDLPF